MSVKKRKGSVEGYLDAVLLLYTLICISMTHNARTQGTCISINICSHVTESCGISCTRQTDPPGMKVIYVA
jgi:hypothetical protein